MRGKGGLLIWIGVILTLSHVGAYAQQLLYPEVWVHSSLPASVSHSAQQTLQVQLTDFLRSYYPQVETYYRPKQLVHCLVQVHLKEGDGFRFKGDITFSITRPIYNSTEESTLLIAKEEGGELEIIDGVLPPLVSGEIPELPLHRLLYYYVTLGLMYYYDSFAPLGGEPFLRHILQHQATLEQAWESLGLSVFPTMQMSYLAPQRHLAELRGQAGNPYREYWYLYHRQGLDSETPNGYADTVKTVAKGLADLRDEYGPIGLLQHFKDTKSIEIHEHLSPTELNELGELAPLIR